MADDAGLLLVREGLIGDEQLLAARQARTLHGGTLGEHLVAGGFIDDETLTSFFRTRLMVPRVDPRKLQEISPMVLRRVPQDMAVEFRVVPVQVDQEQNLILAMSDPSNTHAVDEIGFFTGQYVVRAVASQREIAWCLERYYQTRIPALLGGPTPEPMPEPAAGPVSGERRRVLPPMTSPPPVSGRAVRVSEIVPALRKAKEEAALQAVVREQVERPALPGLPPTAPADRRTIVAELPPEAHAEAEAEAHTRRTQRQLPAQEHEADTRPIMRVELPPAPRVRRSDEPPRAASGEIDAGSGRASAVVGELPAVVITEPEATDEAPILLDRPKPPTDPPMAAMEPMEVDEIVAENDDVVLLEQRKPRRRRPSATRMGTGFEQLDAAFDHDAAEAAVAAKPTLQIEPADSPKKTIPMADLANAVPSRKARGKSTVKPKPRPDPAAPAAVLDESEQTGRFSRDAATSTLADVDDGWGEPGTTIPPPLLGATFEDSGAVKSPLGIPVPDVELPAETSAETRAAAQQKAEEAAPKPVAAPSARTQVMAIPAAASTDAAYDASVRRLSATLRALEQCATRDEVIERLVAHLSAACQRAAFFAVMRGTLQGWTALGSGVDTTSVAEAYLDLSEPSTFQDIVSTRLPFRGPVHDERSRDFLITAVGVPPIDMVAMPVCVRDKVVGILFGDDRKLPLYEDHLNALVRSGGLALERILMAAKSSG